MTAEHIHLSKFDTIPGNRMFDVHVDQFIWSTSKWITKWLVTNQVDDKFDATNFVAKADSLMRTTWNQLWFLQVIARSLVCYHTRWLVDLSVITQRGNFSTWKGKQKTTQSEVASHHHPKSECNTQQHWPLKGWWHPKVNRFRVDEMTKWAFP